MTAVLEAKGLACGYGARPVVSDVSFSLEPGQVLALLGPNGVGKTTLFKTLLGFLPALCGSVLIDGRDAAGLARKDFARAVAYLAQSHTPNFSFTVHDVVLMGRTPYLDGLAMPSPSDEQIAQQTLEVLGMAHLSDRDYSSLSGGERQMVLIARCLAQRPRILVMDEPCSSLDFGNQARLLEQVLKLAGEGLAVVMTTHDPNHAFMLDGEVLCLNRRGAVVRGRAREVLTGQMMCELYGVPVAVGPIPEPADGEAGREIRACVPVLGQREDER